MWKRFSVVVLVLACLASVHAQSCTIGTGTNCATCTTVGGVNACGTCNLGYTLANGACTAAIAGCATYATATTCSKCDDGKILSGALPTTSTGSVFTAGNTVCTAVGTAADKVPNTIVGCATYAAATTGQVIQTSSVCSACDAGKILSGTLPNTGGSGAFTSGSTVCTAVGTAAELIPNTIAGCDKYAAATTGQVIQTGSVCSSCSAGKFLSSNTCVTIAGCATYTSATACSACDDGKILSATLPSGTSGAVFTAGSAVCTAVGTPGATDYLVPNTITGCTTYAAATSTQVIKTGSVCSSCSTGYFLSSGTCLAVTAIPNCATYSSITTCSACVPGQYALMNNACEACPTGTYFAPAAGGQPATCVACNAGCSSCSGAGASACTACPSGFYLTSNTCAACATGGATCTGNTIATLTTCKTGYYASSATSPANCVASVGCTAPSAISSAGAKCTTCTAGYYYANDVCTAYSAAALAGCQTQTTGANTCTTCVSGWLLGSNNLCTKPIANCASIVTVSGVTTCATCATGYYGATGATSCTAVTAVPNCDTYSTTDGKCTACTSAYWINTASPPACTQPIAGCASYTSGTACAACSAGYILSAALPSTSAGAVFTAGTAVCTQVSTTAGDLVPNAIAGCATYKAATSTQVIKTDSKCDACSAGYVLSAALPSTSVGAVFTAGFTVCTQVSTTAGDLVPNAIANCDKYKAATSTQVIKTDSKCLTCATGYGSINSGAACITCAAGCSSCTNAGLAWCSACTTNQFYYTSTVFTGSGTSGVFSTGLPLSCTAYTAAGCATYSSSSNSCATCAAGYTQDMTTGACVANAKASPANALQVQATLVAAMLVLLALFQ